MRGLDPTGLTYAMAANLAWGCFPIYFKFLEPFGAINVIGQRMVWAALVLAVFLTALWQWRAVIDALRSLRTWVLLFLSTLSMGFSWGIYIWAVHSDRILQASMGYYLTPMMTVLVALVMFKERLTPLQWWGVGVAAAGVLIAFVWSGFFPWISFILGGTFAIYSGIRKLVRIEALGGVFIESCFLLPFGYLILLWDGQFMAPGLTWPQMLLLMSSGMVTVLPIIWYVAASRRLPLSFLGTLFYIAPTLGFLSGVFIYGEPFTASDGIMFSLIWLGLILFTLDGLGAPRRARSTR